MLKKILSTYNTQIPKPPGIPIGGKFINITRNASTVKSKHGRNSTYRQITSLNVHFKSLNSTRLGLLDTLENQLWKIYSVEVDVRSTIANDNSTIVDVPPILAPIP